MHAHVCTVGRNGEATTDYFLYSKLAFWFSKNLLLLCACIYQVLNNCRRDS